MADPTGRPLPSAPASPLVGREREQAALRDALAAALTRRGSLVLIGGEAGIGKTALAEWLLAEAAERGALALVGRCYDLSETPPYGPWAEVFARAPSGADLPVPPGFGGSAATSQPTLFGQVRNYLATLAARQPLLLLLEDLHWADPASLDLLRMVARSLAEMPLLLLATYRADEVTRGHPLDALLPFLVREARAERLTLRALTAADLRALVNVRYALAPADEARLVGFLEGRSEGNSLYAGEVLRALEEVGLLRQEGGGWVLDGLEAARVPGLLRQVIDGRVERLGDGARELLVAAAVIGQEVPLGLWAAVSGAVEDDLVATAERAIAARLLAETPDGTGVRFAHALVREALYEGLGALRRPGWHRRAAEAHMAQLAPDPDAVAHHFRQAGDPRAVEWLLRAGVRARRAAAAVSAADRFAAAAGLLAGDAARSRERGWLLFLVGLSLSFSDIARSLRAMDEAEALALAAGDGTLAAHARFNRGRIRCMRGELRPGLAEMEREVAALDTLPREHRLRPSMDLALAMIGASPLGDRVEMPPPASSAPLPFHLVLLTNQFALAGRYREALALSASLAPGADATPAGGTSPGMAPAHLGRGHAHAALGRPAEARREQALAIAAFRASGSRFIVEYSYWFELLVMVLPYQADDLAERARLAAAGARAWEQALGLDTTATHGAQSALPLALLEGRWEEARALAEGGRGSTIVGFSVGALVALGQLARWRGELEPAWARVRDLHPAGPSTEPGDAYFPHGIAALALAAELALDAGDLATAGAWIAAHGRWLDWSGAVLWRADQLLLRARHAVASGDLPTARVHAEAALARASEPRQPLTLLAAHRTLGELATETGHHAAAPPHLDAALALAEACAAPYERALTLLALADLHDAEGRHAEAMAALDDARALLAPLEARPALARADALAARLAAPPAPTPPPALPFGLTAREAEVLRLVAEGLTDPQIADRLFVSRHTVNAHLRGVYGKLGVNTRTAAARLAAEHGLA